MKRIKVKGFVADVKKTASISSVRKKLIDSSPSSDIPESYPANALADILHEKYFTLSVKKAEITEDFILIELTFPEEDKRFYFRNGQLLGIRYTLDGQEDFFSLPIFATSGEAVLKGAFIREYDERAYRFFAENSPKQLSCVSFEGKMTYSGIRDKRRVAVITDGIALPCARSLAEGIKKEYQGSFVSLYYRADGAFSRAVLCDTSEIEVSELSDKGISADGDTSVFICGKTDFCEKIAEMFSFTNLRIHRFDTIREYKSESRHKVRVIFRGEKTELDCFEGVRLSSALLGAGIPSEIRCSDGECGYCRCRLLSGDIKLLTASDKRQAADIKYGYIHPCSVTPVTDIEIEL